MRVLSLLFLLVTSTLVAQNSREQLKLAIQYNDISAAKQAIFQLLADNPDNIDLKDTLAFFYFSQQNYVNCILVCEDVLAEEPDRLNVLEMRAISRENLGIVKDALSDYEKLFMATKDDFFAYKIATVQYMLKRYGECEMTINSLLEKETSQKKVEVYAGKEKQSVSMEAALLNMKGILYYDIGKKEQAIELVKRALQVEPEFILAQSNMNSLQQQMKEVVESEEENADSQEAEKKSKKRK